VADCSKALKFKSDFPAALGNRGFAYLRLRKPAEALADFDAALGIEPRSADTLFGRSVAERLLGDAKAAERDARAARKINPDVESKLRVAGLLR
jgi:tetratricopeptide (TPR) repeat protein